MPLGSTSKCCHKCSALGSADASRVDHAARRDVHAVTVGAAASAWACRLLVCGVAGGDGVGGDGVGGGSPSGGAGPVGLALVAAVLVVAAWQPRKKRPMVSQMMVSPDVNQCGVSATLATSGLACLETGVFIAVVSGSVVCSGGEGLNHR